MEFNPKVVKVVGGLVVASAGLVGASQYWEGGAQADGSSVVYADKLAHNLPTVCSGHTDWKLRVGTAYTKEQCAAIDTADAEKYGLALIKCSGHTADHRVFRNQNEFDAHTLRAINIGIGGACSSRAMKLLKQGKHEEACDALAHGPDGTPVWSYVNNGTEFVDGLYKRRLFERAWCLKPMPTPAPSSPTFALLKAFA